MIQYQSQLYSIMLRYLIETNGSAFAGLFYA